MEEQNNSNLNDILELSKRLVEVQKLRAIVAAKRNVRTIQNTAKATLDSIKNFINIEKRNYGVRQSEADQIIEKYRDTFKQIEEMAIDDFTASYERRKSYEEAETLETLRLIDKKSDIKINKIDAKKIMKQIKAIQDSSEYRENEQNIEAVKAKLDIAIKNEDIREIQIQNGKLEELKKNKLNIKGETVLGQELSYSELLQELKEKQEYIEECKEEVKYAKRNIQEAIANQKREYEINSKNEKIENKAILAAKKEEQKALAVITRTNIFSKAFNSIKNKIGGAKKFANKVVEPLKLEIEELKNEKIPGIKNEIGSKRKECTETCRVFIEKTKGKVVETREQLFNKIAKKIEQKIEKATQQYEQKLQPEK